MVGLIDALPMVGLIDALPMVGLIDALVLGVVFGMVESAGVQPDAPAAQRVFSSQLYKNRLRQRYVKPRCRRKT